MHQLTFNTIGMFPRQMQIYIKYHLDAIFHTLNIRASYVISGNST